MINRTRAALLCGLSLPATMVAAQPAAITNACGIPVHHAFVEVGKHEPPQVFTPEKINGRWEFNHLSEATEPLTVMCFRTTDKASLFRVPLPEGLTRCHFADEALSCSIESASEEPIPTAQHSIANALHVCSKAANQRAINECYGTLYKQADSELQTTYDSLRKKLTPEAATRLRDAQRAWVAYKDNWCGLQSSTVENGSMYPSVLAQCLTRLTNEQLQRLTYQNTCKEDVDCAPKR